MKGGRDFGVLLSLLSLRCGVASDADAGDVSALSMLPCICMCFSSGICFSSVRCSHIPTLSHSSARPTVTLEATGVSSMFPVGRCATAN